MRMKSLSCGAAAFVANVVLLGCSPSSTDLIPEPVLNVTTQDQLVFYTQNRVPDAVMDALFTGTIHADDDGCLRPGPESQSTFTFVWPKSYGLDTSGGSAVVMDDQGETVGALGEEFTLGGGEVVELLDSMGFTEEDRAAAEACPGRFWIVSPPGI